MESPINEQFSAYAHTKNFMRNYNKDSKSRKTKICMENRLNMLCEYWKEFKDTHKVIIKLKGSEEVPDTCKRYFEPDLYNIVEEYFLQAKTELQEDKLKLYPEKNEDPKKNLESSDKSDDKSVEKEDIKLPRINIPKFSVDYKNWMSFHDLFSTLIHNNKALSNVQRLHYLKSCLQGDAEQLVRHFTKRQTMHQPGNVCKIDTIMKES